MDELGQAHPEQIGQVVYKLAGGIGHDIEFRIKRQNMVSGRETHRILATATRRPRLSQGETRKMRLQSMLVCLRWNKQQSAPSKK